MLRWDRPRYYNGRLIGYTVESCLLNEDGKTTEQRGACTSRQVVTCLCVNFLGV